MPPDYVFYRWRKIMHASYEDFLITPVEVIMKDLAFHRYEEEVKHMQYQNQDPQIQG